MSLSTDPRLGLLPEFEPRSSSFTMSTLANLTAAVVFVFVAMSGIHEHVEVPVYTNTELLFPVPAAPAVSTPVQEPRVVEKARAKVHLAPVVQRTPHFQMPALPAIPMAAKAAAPSAAGNQVASAVAKIDPKPVLGAFGDPMGVVPSATAKTGTIQRVGNFDAPVAENQASGNAPQGAVQTAGFGNGVTIGGPGAGPGGHGKAMSAGFGTGVAPAGDGRGHGSVAKTEFNTPAPAAASEPMVARTENSSFVPPVVMFEPAPRYTAEARSLKIQGQVVLEVRMGATGKIDILRIVNGLGHGLDEEAAAVTRHIKFKPAMKNGQALDQVTFVHVFFRLA